MWMWSKGKSITYWPTDYDVHILNMYLELLNKLVVIEMVEVTVGGELTKLGN